MSASSRFSLAACLRVLWCFSRQTSTQPSMLICCCLSYACPSVIISIPGPWTLTLWKKLGEKFSRASSKTTDECSRSSPNELVACSLATSSSVELPALQTWRRSRLKATASIDHNVTMVFSCFLEARANGLRGKRKRPAARHRERSGQRLLGASRTREAQVRDPIAKDSRAERRALRGAEIRALRQDQSK